MAHPIASVQFCGYLSRMRGVAVNVLFATGPMVSQYLEAQCDGKGNCLFFSFMTGKHGKFPLYTKAGMYRRSLFNF